MDLFELMRHGDEKVHAHDSFGNLAESARSFLACVSEWKHFTVEPASPAAERLLGAAMMLDPSLRGGRSARTVVLDVNIASGTLVANAAQRVRDAVEPEWLIAVVINSLTDLDLQWAIDGVDTLIVCDPSSVVAAKTHSGQTSDYGVSVRAVQRQREPRSKIVQGSALEANGASRAIRINDTDGLTKSFAEHEQQGPLAMCPREGGLRPATNWRCAGTADTSGTDVLTT
ncbi:hypothetical protein [Arthrobacter sp. NPDC080082]|uniref:hypothetical protein n=1 Tax=unclassified Arthrobacter TaxID=235627 RepID=UPI003449A9E3